MVNLNDTLNSRVMTHPAAAPRRMKPQTVTTPTTPTQTRAIATPQATTQATPQTTAKATASTPSSAPDFRALFNGTVTPAVPDPGPPPAPTAESVFGANPWLKSPMGQGPTGAYAFNPFYFATPETAAKVAAMVGGTVVQSNQFTPNGGPFAQSQPNQMVQLADGRMINPGLVASFYTHGYPQSYIDRMIADEVRNA